MNRAEGRIRCEADTRKAERRAMGRDDERDASPVDVDYDSVTNHTILPLTAGIATIVSP